jgi:hypothetical protein
MMSHFLVLIITIIAVITTTVNAQETYDKFDGTISESSSWFDTSRWTTRSKIPSKLDTVWIDESNTYVAIDASSTHENIAAEVSELVIGRSESSNSIESVQVDLLEGAKLNVATNMIIGQYLESDGTVYVSHNSQITVGETLTIGSDGSGIVILTGSAQINANDINICDQSSSSGVGGCKLIMDDDSKLTINGDKRNKLNQMIEYGLIVFSSSQEGEQEENGNKAFQVTTNKISNDDDGGQTTTVKIITVGLPTDSPTSFIFVSTEEPTNKPTTAPAIACKDLKFAWKKKKKKNCKWVAKKRKCSKKYKRKSIKNYWCKESCGKCPADAIVFTRTLRDVEDITEDTTLDNNININNNSINCLDSKTLKYQNISSKDCKWVSENTKYRCIKEWDGHTLADICPQTCGGITSCA